MDEFVQELILAYFKERKEQYSFQELAICLGISQNATTEHIQALITSGELEYKDSLLRLTLAGRTRIQNSAMDYFRFTQEEKSNLISDVNISEAWPIERVYIPKSFSRKAK